MKARLAKLDQLARRINAEYESERDGHDRMMSLIAGAMLCDLPDLALVTEADTDPATYADIRSTVSYARGDWDGGRRWSEQVLKTEMPRLPGETSRDWCVRRINQCGLDARESTDARHAAIANAKKRLGKV